MIHGHRRDVTMPILQSTTTRLASLAESKALHLILLAALGCILAPALACAELVPLPTHSRLTRSASASDTAFIPEVGKSHAVDARSVSQATVVVRETFSGRFGVPIEGFQAYLKVTRARDRHVLINRAFGIERHSARLVLAPGRYELTRYAREGGPIACVVGGGCTQELGAPEDFCSYRLRLRSAQVLSLLVTATSRWCSIRRTQQTTPAQRQ
jgi:hypothetical protein